MIKKIKLKNFRIFDNYELNIKNSLVIISGKNATGKTSILEAIYLCSSSKSLRDNEIENLIKFDKDYLDVEVESEINKYRVIISKNEKSYLINNKKINKIKDFIGSLSCVMLSPADLNIVNGIKGERRKFLDLEISLINKKYLSHLTKYKKIINERNDILKSKDIDKIYLKIVTEGLIKELKEIYEIRNKFIDDLNIYLLTICKEMNIEKLEISYKPSYDINNLEKSFDEKLERDILTKVTNIGSHRDDFKILLNNNDIKLYGSEGQKRMSIIAIKLALKEYIEKNINNEVILLLDDCFLALDKEKIINLTKEVKKSKQVFITTTSVLEIPDSLLQNAEVIRIDGGKESAR